MKNMTATGSPVLLANELAAVRSCIALFRAKNALEHTAVQCRVLLGEFSDNGGPPSPSQNAADPELSGFLTGEVYSALDTEGQNDLLSIACQSDMRARQLRRAARLSDLDFYAQRRATRLLTKIAALKGT